jgi:hypothetical protein
VVGAGIRPSGSSTPPSRLKAASCYAKGAVGRRRPSRVEERDNARRSYPGPMSRNFRTLYNFDPPATDEEVQAAALQYVRKISGFTKPSQANEEAFAQAVDAVAEVSRDLLKHLTTTAPPKDREVERAKARARAEQRFAA